MTNWCCDCAHEEDFHMWKDRCFYFCIPNQEPGKRPWGHEYASDSPFRWKEIGTFPDRDENDKLIMEGERACPYCGAKMEFTEEAVIRHMKSCGKGKR